MSHSQDSTSAPTLRLLDELPHLLAAFDATTLLVTHNRHEALRLAQDLVVLVEGRVHAAGDKHEVATNPRVAEVAEVLGYTVLEFKGRRVGIPPDGLRLGPGRHEFSMDVEDVMDLVEYREVVGRVGDARVHVPVTDGTAQPGDRVLVHAERVCDLTREIAACDGSDCQIAIDSLRD